MDDKQRLDVLEQALAQMLKPIKGIPFSVIVKSMSETQVIQINKDHVADRDLIDTLERAIIICAADLKSNPIKRPRPNEVGNDVETYVMRALSQSGLKASRPTSKAGRGKATGYPDISFARRSTSRHLSGMQDIFTRIGGNDHALVLLISFRVIQSFEGRPPPSVSLWHAGRGHCRFEGVTISSKIIQIDRFV